MSICPTTNVTTHVCARGWGECLILQRDNQSVQRDGQTDLHGLLPPQHENPTLQSVTTLNKRTNETIISQMMVQLLQ